MPQHCSVCTSGVLYSSGLVTSKCNTVGYLTMTMLTFCFIPFHINETVRPFYCLSVLFPFIPSLNQFWLAGHKYVVAHKMIICIRALDKRNESKGYKMIWPVTKMYSSCNGAPVAVLQAQMASLWWLTLTNLFIQCWLSLSNAELFLGEFAIPSFHSCVWVSFLYNGKEHFVLSVFRQYRTI